MSAPQIRRRWQAVDGVLLLNKDGGMTSNTALQKARRLFNAAKAGHTGTLDPMAIGLLPVLFGEATKFSHVLLDADKTYVANILLGVTTTTADAEGEVLAQVEVRCDEAAVHAACARFVGEIEQVPPMYSALKHQGKALYEYARQGVEIERQARRVVIHELVVESIELPHVRIRVRCSKGTYVRTLAEDIGRALACGAHLTGLQRVTTGPLVLADAYSLAALEALDEARRTSCLLPVDVLLHHLPLARLGEELGRRFCCGNPVPWEASASGECRVYVGMRFVGLGRQEEGRLEPVRLVAQHAS